MARTAVPQFDLYGYDAEKRQQFPLLCGVDEAGRGPLAGDVYAAAVILSPEHLPEGLNDSKKLSEKNGIYFRRFRSRQLPIASLPQAWQKSKPITS